MTRKDEIINEMFVEMNTLVTFYKEGVVESEKRCGMCDGDVPAGYEVVPEPPLMRLEYLLSYYDKLVSEEEARQEEEAKA